MENPKFYGEEIARLRDSLFRNISSGEDFNDYYFSVIHKYIKGSKSVLDLGTGNGYVLSKLLNNFSNYPLSLFGIDNSQAMVARATKALEGKASIYLGDNSNLPFVENSFDLITAKNVTSICIPEIRRVLNKNGHFIFREYGSGKGLVEVAELFPKARLIRSKDLDYYVSELIDNGFTIKLAEEHKIQRRYNSEELIKIAQSYPFIDGFSVEDEKNISERFKQPSEQITSDILIIVARRRIWWFMIH